MVKPLVLGAGGAVWGGEVPSLCRAHVQRQAWLGAGEGVTERFTTLQQGNEPAAMQSDCRR